MGVDHACDTATNLRQACKGLKSVKKVIEPWAQAKGIDTSEAQESIEFRRAREEFEAAMDAKQAEEQQEAAAAESSSSSPTGGKAKVGFSEDSVSRRKSAEGHAVRKAKWTMGKDKLLSRIHEEGSKEELMLAARKSRFEDSHAMRAKDRASRYSIAADTQVESIKHAF